MVKSRPLEGVGIRFGRSTQRAANVSVGHPPFGCVRHTAASPRTADALSTMSAWLFRAKALNRFAIAAGCGSS
jgi:hypothetical protein